MNRIRIRIRGRGRGPLQCPRVNPLPQLKHRPRLIAKERGRGGGEEEGAEWEARGCWDCQPASLPFAQQYTITLTKPSWLSIQLTEHQVDRIANGSYTTTFQSNTHTHLLSSSLSISKPLSTYQILTIAAPYPIQSHPINLVYTIYETFTIKDGSNRNLERNEGSIGESY